MNLSFDKVASGNNKVVKSVKGCQICRKLDKSVQKMSLNPFLAPLNRDLREVTKLARQRALCLPRQNRSKNPFLQSLICQPGSNNVNKSVKSVNKLTISVRTCRESFYTVLNSQILSGADSDSRQSR